MFFFFKQKTAYEMRISDWSSDVCSSDLRQPANTPSPLNGRETAMPRVAPNLSAPDHHSPPAASSHSSNARSTTHRRARKSRQGQAPSPAPQSPDAMPRKAH